MNIVTIDEHSFCPELLPEKANILDAGCRGFGFTNYFRDRGHDVLAIDIDKFEGDYKNIGLSSERMMAFVSGDADPQARKISHTGKSSLPCFTLTDIESIHGSEFDLIKLDIEGEEFPVLMSIQHPAAKQISVEFHAHTGANTKSELDALLNWLGEWYTIHGTVWEKRHGCSENYWDVLLIAK